MIKRELAVALVAVAAMLTFNGPVKGPESPADDPTAPTCWVGPTEDSEPVAVRCDYRDGAWHPVVTTCGPGARLVHGTCREETP